MPRDRSAETRFRVKGPNTYRKEHPGQHIIVVMAVDPRKEGAQLLFEMPTDKAFHDEMVRRCVEHMNQSTKEASGEAPPAP